MKFKPGDLVIKSTGGNKMRILGYKDGLVDCVCATESIHEGLFEEKDLISIDDFKDVIKHEKRDDLINNILRKDEL